LRAHPLDFDATDGDEVEEPTDDVEEDVVGGDGGGDDDGDVGDSDAVATADDAQLSETARVVADAVGSTLGQLHAASIVHGDLTTSNLMLRARDAAADAAPVDAAATPTPTLDVDPTRVVVIDFGLAYVSAVVEDQSVDLYVLERAFLSTHPKSAVFFARILRAYARSHDNAAAVLKRLAAVRARGRKKTMLG
jgi:TP53 regulating kinase-like protein